jgi:2-polyprenyl-6-methoxyphenol hydroxylase-like FAD-dependent oxidoreductase
MAGEQHTDVLIAGAGPFGLMLACELGRRGIDCLLIDPKIRIADAAQANATQARTMEHFRRLGLAAAIRALGLPPDHPTDIGYFTRFTGKELARLPLPTAREAAENVKRLGGSWSAAELPHRISQKFVEATLLRHARSQASVEVRLGWALDAFQDCDESVLATLAVPDMADAVGPAQEPVRVRCRYLVGADGARSRVRNALGIRHGGVTGVRRDFMGGQMFAVHLRAPLLNRTLPHRRCWMNVAVNAQRRGFMCALDGETEFVFHAALQPHEEAGDWGAAEGQRLFDEAMGRPFPVEILSTGTWTAGHSLVATAFRRGRVFIGGDAAHLFTPTGGLGYNTAVEDAVNLGWKLALVLKGIAQPSLLDSYELERKPLAERNTAYARRFADSIGNFRATPLLEDDSPAGAAERAAASGYLNAHARLEFNIPGVTFGGRYDHSPLIVKDGSAPPPDDANVYIPTATPGGRPPHAWLDGERSLFDTFNFEWTLLVLGPQPPDAEPFRQHAAGFGIDLALVEHDATALLELYEAPLVLIRPDQIVAWRGSSARCAQQVLAQVIGR